MWVGVEFLNLFSSTCCQVERFLCTLPGVDCISSSRLAAVERTVTYITREGARQTRNVTRMDYGSRESRWDGKIANWEWEWNEINGWKWGDARGLWFFTFPTLLGRNCAWWRSTWKLIVVFNPLLSLIAFVIRVCMYILLRDLWYFSLSCYSVFHLLHILHFVCGSKQLIWHILWSIWAHFPHGLCSKVDTVVA